MINPDERLTILANKNVSRGKMAAAAVHAALMHYGIPHGAVIVLGASPGRIEDECSLIIRDAGRTEVEPGTVTAGVRKGEDDAQRHALLDAATELTHMREARDNARAEVERLTARLDDVEEALVELQPDPVLVEGSWIPFRDLATVCGNFMRSSAEHARAAKAAHVRVAELEAAVERVRATAEHYDELSYAGCAAAIFRALGGEADRG